ncbi:MAG TPA: tetratricopeptide repeat protein [Bacteroidales bacterium]|nr:tetratricopeptide repeat protein [Bacteroidales bacterium]
MKPNRLFILAAIVMLFTASCTNPRTKQLDLIAEKEQSIFGDTIFWVSHERAHDLVAAYIAFSDKFPTDTLAPEMIFRAADISMNTGSPQAAVEMFTRIIDDYPEFRKVPEIYFLMAFAYDNHLRDFDNARRYYKEFISRFPEHELADDAGLLIHHLGKSPDELIKEFEALRQQESGITN